MSSRTYHRSGLITALLAAVSGLGCASSQVKVTLAVVPQPVLADVAPVPIGAAPPVQPTFRMSWQSVVKHAGGERGLVDNITASLVHTSSRALVAQTVRTSAEIAHLSGTAELASGNALTVPQHLVFALPTPSSVELEVVVDVLTESGNRQSTHVRVPVRFP